MSEVKLELERTANQTRIYIDGVEVDDCRAVQVFASVNNLTVVVLELVPEKVTIVGPAEVINQLHPTGRARVLVGGQEVAEASSFTVIPAARLGEPGEQGSGGNCYARIESANGYRRLRCERLHGHEGQHLVASLTGHAAGGESPLELWTWPTGGEVTRVLTAVCHRCRTSREVRELMFTPRAAEPFACLYEADCGARRTNPADPCHHRELLAAGPSPFWCVLPRGHAGAHAVGDVPAPDGAVGTVGYGFDDRD